MEEKNPKRQQVGYDVAARMTPDARKERARKASIGRWKKKKGEEWSAPLPEAIHKGVGILGGADIECYVLSNGERLISLTQCVKAISGKDTGQLGEYIGVDSLKSLISSKKVPGETIDFLIPENGTVAKGLKAETFADICGAYVEANYLGILKTDRQKEIAARCAFLQLSFVKVGIVAFIDEVTGYQNFRAKNELELKLNAYLARYEREWEKTFPDELYREFGRLCNLKDWRKKQPHYAQITRNIYNLLDPDVAKKLIELDTNPKVHQHQYLSEEFGITQLKSYVNQVLGLAKSCESIQEFNDKIKLLDCKKDRQMVFSFYR